MCVDLCGNCASASPQVAIGPDGQPDYGCCGCADPRIGERKWLKAAGSVIAIVSLIEFGVGGSINPLIQYGRALGSWWVCLFTLTCGLAAVYAHNRGWVCSVLVLSSFCFLFAAIGMATDSSNKAMFDGITACVKPNNATYVNSAAHVNSAAGALAQAVYCRGQQYSYSSSYVANACFCTDEVQMYGALGNCYSPMTVADSGDCSVLYGKVKSRLSVSAGLLGALLVASMALLVLSSKVMCRCCGDEQAAAGAPAPPALNQFVFNGGQAMNAPGGAPSGMLVQLPDGSLAMVQPVAHVHNGTVVPMYVQSQPHMPTVAAYLQHAQQQQPQPQYQFAQPYAQAHPIQPGYSAVSPPQQQQVYPPSSVASSFVDVSKPMPAQLPTYAVPASPPVFAPGAANIPSATVAVLNSNNMR